MKLSCFPAALLALTFSCTPALSQSSPHRGLWVGEVFLNAVNQTTVPLDEDNIPRAADPNVATPTADVANLRLLLHVDAGGQVSLLKHVAILSRKAGEQSSESDLALVTDPSLYGAFPPQPAKRISAVAFDYGDARPTHLLNRLVEGIADAAASKAVDATQDSAPTAQEVQNAALGAGQAVVNTADAANAYATFLRNNLSASAVRTIANGGSIGGALTAANNLKTSSVFGDTRGVELLNALSAALDALPADTPSSTREQTALNTVASFADTERGYDRFLAGEAFGDFLTAASEAAAAAAAATTIQPISSFEPSSSSPLTVVISPAHGLANQTEIAIQGASLGSRNGLHRITVRDPDSFEIPVSFHPGSSITSFSAHTQIAPLVITSPSHGLSNGSFVVLRDTPAEYAGRHLVTVVDTDRFSIDVPFVSDPTQRGTWAARSGAITGYASSDSGETGTLITAANHGLNNGDRIRIEGSGQESYNGSKTITRISPNSFSIDQAFAGDPQQKGTWEVAVGIQGFSPPAAVPTLVESAGHGLQSGDRITISGSSHAPYNGTHSVERLDADRFAIPVSHDPANESPATNAAWQPATGGHFRVVTSIREALDSTPEVNSIRSEALRVNIDAYSDTRPQEAVALLIEAIIRSASSSSSLSPEILSDRVRAAAVDVLVNDVPRYPAPSTVPSAAYDEFIRSSAFTGAPAIAAQAAAEAAVAERSQLIATSASIRDKALQAAITSLRTTFAAAARALLPELPLSGQFGPGSTGLEGEIFLPASHPTNPFRHRRHPDHTLGIDVRRQLTLNFDSEDVQPLRRPNFGIDRITGTYEEEIFGLHKPLGPDRDIGLKVRGTFELNRISLIDALNGR